MNIIIGKTADGKIVATDHAAESWKAERIAADWRSSGLEVEIQEKTTLQD